MSKLFLLAVVLIPGSLYCFAQGTYNAQWKKGADCYQQKQYDSAAYYFEQIAALKPQNATVYYNLGNAYYRLNKVGQAVLNYQRALKINPEYKEAKENLELAQSRISNHIPTAPDIFFVAWWNNITRPNLAAPWAVASFITFLIIFVLLTVRHFRNKELRLIPVQLPAILGLVCACFLLFAFIAGKNMQSHDSAVVMQNDAPLMNNDQKGKPLALVPEGTYVRIKDERGIWIEVSLPDGRTGWLQKDLISKI